jgi:hypothetical protein
VGIGIVTALTIAGVRAHDPITTRVTWHGEVARIVEARCVRCHSPEGRGPMSLATYEDARPWAKAIKEEVMTRRMPKWHAVRGYGAFSNDPSLSPFEIALIAAWADGGAPKGVPAAKSDKPKRRLNEARSVGTVRPLADGRAREIALPCGDHALPEGTLLGIRPETRQDGSVGMAVRFPDGRREIVGWVRNFDPDFSTTYWLRDPLVLASGSALSTEPRDGCTVTVTLRPR